MLPPDDRPDDPARDPAEEPALDAAELLRPYPSEELRTYRVSTAVNSARNDRPECLEPAG